MLENWGHTQACQLLLPTPTGANRAGEEDLQPHFLCLQQACSSLQFRAVVKAGKLEGYDLDQVALPRRGLRRRINLGPCSLTAPSVMASKAGWEPALNIHHHSARWRPSGEVYRIPEWETEAGWSRRDWLRQTVSTGGWCNCFMFAKRLLTVFFPMYQGEWVGFPLEKVRLQKEK